MRDTCNLPSPLSSRRSRVKFCGITRIEDAKQAEALGVDALGFVFYEQSPRHLNIQTAIDIANALGPFITKVGLFVNPTTEQVERVLSQVPLDILQFHGEETDSFCHGFKKSFIKSVHVQTADDIMEAVSRYPHAAALLLDTYHKTLKGGTGKRFDWRLIPKSCGKPLILAGGLTAENVRDAIGIAQPYAVDVSSGIEKDKGIKSFEKMQLFMNGVYNVS